MIPIRARKKPIVIEAMRWLGKVGAASVSDLQEWGVVAEPTGAWGRDGDPDEWTLLVYNSEETQAIRCPVGHYIIKGVNGEFYPCSPDVFEKTYEVITETS